jgi:hypothetical protein
MGWRLLGTSYLVDDSLRTVVLQSNDSIEAGTGVNTGGVMLVLNRKRSPETRLTSVSTRPDGSPSSFFVSQPYPNPFNPQTTVRYALHSSARVKITVYDLLGREVAILLDDVQPAGEWMVQWKAAQAPSGLYLIRVTAGDRSQVVKALLLR